MNVLKVNSLSFLHNKEFLIDKDGYFYIDRYYIDGGSYQPCEIVIYNQQFEEISCINYKEASDFMKIMDSQDSFKCFYKTFDDKFIIGTKNNAVFVFDKDGKMISKIIETDKDVFSKLREERQARLIQKKHFASNFYDTRDNKVICITSGYGFGWITERGRYILGISKEPNPSFELEMPFDTIYLNDTYQIYKDYEREPVWVTNMDMANFKNKLNIWNEYHDFFKYKNSMFRQYLDDRNKYYEVINAHKLGNPTGNNSAFKSFLFNMSINQAIDLNETQLLITVFTDGQSKSDYPDKRTPYYFLIIDKLSGEIIRDISPNDTSVYNNNHPYMIVDDRKYDRLIFKTYDYLYFFNNKGEIYEKISLLDKKFSSFRNWSYLGISNHISFFYDHKKNNIYSFELGETLSDIDENIMNAIKTSRKY